MHSLNSSLVELIKSRSNRWSLWSEKALAWLVSALRVQLVLMICSLPIVISWGLPISFLTILGNLLFSPFIFLFLIGALIFFLGLFLGISLTPLAWLLERITTCWMICMSYAPEDPFFMLPCPSIFILLLIPVSCWIVLIYYSTSMRRMRELGALTCLFCAWVCIVKFSVSYNHSFVPYRTGLLILYVDKNTKKMSLVDPDRLLREGKSLNKWIYNDLRPILIKEYGRIDCDNLVLLKPDKKSLNGACQVIKLLKIQQLSLPADGAEKIQLPLDISARIITCSSEELDCYRQLV